MWLLTCAINSKVGARIVLAPGISTYASPPVVSPGRPSPISNSQSAKLFNFVLLVPVASINSLMFFESLRTLQKCHKYEELIEAYTITCLMPLGITGRICLKSPPNTITFPSNGKLALKESGNLSTSLKHLSNAS